MKEKLQKFDGEALRKLRLRLNIRQSEVAESVGIGPEQIYKIETGKAQPSRKRRRMIEIWMERNDPKIVE